MRETTIIFDGIIALLLAVIPLYFWELKKRWRAIPFKGRYVLTIWLLGALWLAVFYGSFVEPRLLVVGRYQTAVGESGQSISVAVISDTHLGVYKGRAWVERLVRRTNALRPDLILLAGDFAANDAGLEALEPFRDLQAPLGKFAVLGNFDYRVGGVDVRQRIESYGIEVLTNESVRVERAGREVRFIGLDDLWFGNPDWDAAMSEVPDGALTIVAAHNPDAARQAEVLGVDVVLAGHTHGGQVRLPLLGPLTKLPVTIGQRFDKGLFDHGPVRLLISPGAGETAARARFFCPPEISFLEIAY